MDWSLDAPRRMAEESFYVAVSGPGRAGSNSEEWAVLIMAGLSV
jgi:hypothetical protein